MSYHSYLQLDAVTGTVWWKEYLSIIATLLKFKNVILFGLHCFADTKKKAPGQSLEEEEASPSSDSNETDDGSVRSGKPQNTRRRKLKVRIPGFSPKVERLKTC